PRLWNRPLIADTSHGTGPAVVRSWEREYLYSTAVDSRPPRGHPGAGSPSRRRVQAMKNRFLTSRVPALALAAALAGITALALAETGRRQVALRPTPDTRLQARSDRTGASVDSRGVRTLIEDLENSSPEDVRAGRIDRFFTDPAVIITNGRMHYVDWGRVRNDRTLEREPADRNAAPGDRAAPQDTDSRDRVAQQDADARDRADQQDADARDRASQRDADAPDRAAQPNTDVRIESYETRRIDPRTMV